ncbi:MAG: RNA-binding protein [Dehalococcoidaceae bacterium]|nr:RNA-binding protein [Dehalococcoidaceae bacterium]
MKRDSMNIYVGNLSLETTREELMEEFRPYGEVVTVRVLNDKDIGSGQNRGYGFVEMASKDEGINAVAGLDGKKINNRVVKVVEAMPLSHKARSSISHSGNRLARTHPHTR